MTKLITHVSALESQTATTIGMALGSLQCLNRPGDILTPRSVRKRGFIDRDTLRSSSVAKTQSVKHANGRATRETEMQKKRPASIARVQKKPVAKLSMFVSHKKRFAKRITFVESKSRRIR